MARSISVKMPEEDVRRTDAAARQASLSRNSYINKAVRFFNRLQERKRLGLILREESRLVRRESESVLRDFEAFEDEGGW